MQTDARSLEVELSGLTDLFIQFISSTVLGSVDIAAHKTNKNEVLVGGGIQGKEKESGG